MNRIFHRSSVIFLPTPTGKNKKSQLFVFFRVFSDLCGHIFDGPSIGISDDDEIFSLVTVYF
uniref:Uncharacterized protein n=1 Tax=Candidatus Kentrum sp. FW TaxID=2126338 RepID=A0A450SW36_9GAMM|nr:MAG: hypothetical protein BECKFW1821B_GA0114236_10404 [Candidatus Kentron sp. FW]